jgi:DNA sulfur modification protein DndB
MGTREYYTAMVNLSVVPRLFRFRDWSELPPEHRAQRVLQKSRVPEITQYILDNPDDYLFSALTASFPEQATFRPFGNANSNIGELEIPLESDLIINDGQHRRAAIEEALKQNPDIGEHRIAVVLFPCEDLDRLQQMFSDLNRTAKPTSKSLNILFNHRDLMAQVTLGVVESVREFRELVEKDKTSLSQRSPKLFTLSALHDANIALLNSVSEETQESKLATAIEYWTEVAEMFSHWHRVADGELKASEIRMEYIHSQSVVVWALGSVGRSLFMHHPADWKTVLKGLQEIDWRRINREWQRIAMMGTQVINRRTNRQDTASFIKKKLGLPLTPDEEKALLLAVEPELAFEELRSFAPAAAD